MSVTAFFDREEFTKDWEARMPVKDMAAKYHTSENNVSRRALRVLGLQSRVMPPDSKRAKEILAYYKTHTIPETVEALGVTRAAVQRVAKAAGYYKQTKVGKLRKPSKRAKPVERKPIMVMKSVPKNFEAPTRGIGW